MLDKGSRVITKPTLDNAVVLKYWHYQPERVNNRCAGKTGVIRFHSPGDGCWWAWVTHDDGTEGIYHQDELEQALA